jgi:hypothetical protein
MIKTIHSTLLMRYFSYCVQNNHSVDDAMPNNKSCLCQIIQPLPCDRWIASSALQKAIRRGDVRIAQRALSTLYRPTIRDRPHDDCSSSPERTSGSGPSTRWCWRSRAQRTAKPDAKREGTKQPLSQPQRCSPRPPRIAAPTCLAPPSAPTSCERPVDPFPSLSGSNSLRSRHCPCPSAPSPLGIHPGRGERRVGSGELAALLRTELGLPENAELVRFGFSGCLHGADPAKTRKFWQSTCYGLRAARSDSGAAVSSVT